MTLDYVREDGSHGTITVSGQHGVSLVKRDSTLHGRYVMGVEAPTGYEFGRVELRGTQAREDLGPSFARAFVAGLRQGGDTSPLTRMYRHYSDEIDYAGYDVGTVVLGY